MTDIYINLDGRFLVPGGGGGSTDHNTLTNNGGVGSHAALTAHVSDTTIHFPEGVVGAGNIGMGAQVVIDVETNPVAVATETILNWDNEIFDDISFHDNLTNNTRLTVSAGVSRVRVDALVAFPLTFNANVGELLILLNNSEEIKTVIAADVNFIRTVTGSISYIFDVIGGDFFEIAVRHDETGIIQFNDARNTFSITILQ